MKNPKKALISFLMGKIPGESAIRIDRAAEVVVGPPQYQKMLRIKEWCEENRENVNTSSIDEVLEIFGMDPLLPKVRSQLEANVFAKHNISLKELSVELGITPGALSKMVHDSERGITITNTLKMLEIFKIEVLTGTEKKVDPKKKLDFNPEIAKLHIRIAELEEENQMLKVMLSEKELAFRLKKS